MKYILGLFVSLVFFGCSDSASEDATQSSNDTQKLQPELENRELQPPKPPAL